MIYYAGKQLNCDGAAEYLLLPQLPHTLTLEKRCDAHTYIHLLPPPPSLRFI